jgi:hypothetical protein
MMMTSGIGGLEFLLQQRVGFDDEKSLVIGNNKFKIMYIYTRCLQLRYIYVWTGSPGYHMDA